ncbi:MAG: PHP domain-containing protein [Chloroflexi bacterium]|nr:PHP domain-containing protein [Chloroflexota bacterium]
MKADLHLHSTASDGRFTPEELVRHVFQSGLTLMALTDHDSVDGAPAAIAAARAFPPLEVIPGVEIGTDVPHGEVHVLGYFVDYKSAGLLSRLESLRSGRVDRAQRMITKLKKLGVDIEWRRVQELAGGGSIGRPHIAQAMLEKGYIPNLKEAFNKYIGRDGPAYAEREKLTPEGAVQLVIRAGGLPVLAHPNDIESIDKLLIELKAAGLVGMEVYYGLYPAETVRRLKALAKRYDLIPCGGTDYHGLDTMNEAALGSILVPQESVDRLLALTRKKV